MLRYLIYICISLSVYSCSSKEPDSIQLLIECKEQQDALQEQINALNIRIQETDKTIIRHWIRLQEQLNSTQVKEAPTTNE